jgi:hypothetical protein
VTEVRILCISASGRSGGLTEPIAFQKRATEADLEEFHNILVQRSRASNHGLNCTSENRLHLFENEEVVTAVSVLDVVH